MELKFVVPNVEKTLGELLFGSEGETSTGRVNGQTRVTSRSYHLFSSVQLAEDVIVTIPATAGEKNFNYEDKVKVVNPRITAEGNNIGGRGFTKYIINADDIVKA